MKDHKDIRKQKKLKRETRYITIEKSEEQTCIHESNQERNECWYSIRPTGGEEGLVI